MEIIIFCNIRICKVVKFINLLSNYYYYYYYYDKWLEITLDKKHYLLAEVNIAKPSLLTEYIAVNISSYVEVLCTL